MKNSENGEFELVVGNRQLLSGFFIVVLLLGVTFAMGYAVGQNSPRTQKPDDAAAASPATEPAGQPHAMPPAQTQPPAQSVPATEPEGSTPQPVTQPARETETSVMAQNAPPATAPAADVPTGSYWQMGAWKNSSYADALLQTLKESGYPASIKLGADNLYHVMVGPYSDLQTMGRIKTELETKFGLHVYRK